MPPKGVQPSAAAARPDGGDESDERDDAKVVIERRLEALRSLPTNADENQILAWLELAMGSAACAKYSDKLVSIESFTDIVEVETLNLPDLHVSGLDKITAKKLASAANVLRTHHRMHLDTFVEVCAVTSQRLRRGRRGRHLGSAQRRPRA